mmetsp:Transcript_60734/g.153565  ORF Transcript_60734/g.153565 Transcript_60734/m.153565 type:complete len:698 (+) Transcript_60734:115-2208(+)
MSPTYLANCNRRQECGSSRSTSRGRGRRENSSRGQRPGHDCNEDVSSCSEADAEPPDPDMITMTFVPEEAAFLQGNQGGAIKSVARASGARVKLRNHNRTLDIAGSPEARSLAWRYVKIILAQMQWPVRLGDTEIDGDCSMVSVPEVAIALLTGTRGVHLRRLEEEWGVILLFVEYHGQGVHPATGGVCQDSSTGRSETLAIFGPKRGRRGAQLAAMNAIESELPGFFSDGVRVDDELYEDFDGGSEDWGTSTMQIKESVVPYAWGKNGSTRKKLMRASGCIMQLLGNIVIMSGTAQERSRAQEYVTMLLETLEGPVYVDSPEARADVTIVHVPGPVVGFVTGVRRESLGRHEEEWGVLMVFLGHHGQRGCPPPDSVVDLLIFGCDERSRKGAEINILCAIEFKSAGFCSAWLSEKTSDEEGFDEERRLMTQVQVSYVLGSKGAIRKQLAVASGAILQFVGTVCCIAGTGPERQRCKRYIGWLLSKLNRNGEASIDTRGRDDVTEIYFNGVSNKGVGIVTGRGGKTLWGIAVGTGTWCIIAGDHNAIERLCIFSYHKGSWNGDDGGRRRAERLFRDQLKEAKRYIQMENSQNGLYAGRDTGSNRELQRDSERSSCCMRRDDHSGNADARDIWHPGRRDPSPPQSLPPLPLRRRRPPPPWPARGAPAPWLRGHGASSAAAASRPAAPARPAQTPCKSG